jgi:Leucine-rich repeat (LRR) protein
VEELSNRYTCNFESSIDASHLDGKTNLDVKQIILNNGSEIVSSGLFLKYPNVEILKANACGIKALDKKFFEGANKLRELDLSQNEISKIDSKTFVEAANLIYLDLASNKISKIQDHTFYGISSLLYLDFSNNLLDYLDSKFFAELIDIKVIELGGNKIKSLNKDVFLNNKSLKSIRLSRNEISYIDPEFFKQLPGRCKVQLWKNACIHNGYTPNRGATIGSNDEFFEIISKNCNKQ